MIGWNRCGGAVAGGMGGRGGHGGGYLESFGVVCKVKRQLGLHGRASGHVGAVVESRRRGLAVARG